MNEDTWELVVNIACDDYDASCTLQQTSTKFRNLVHTIMSTRLERLKHIHNTWIIFRTSRGIVDVFATQGPQTTLQSFLDPILSKWKIITYTKVIHSTNGYSWKEDYCRNPGTAVNVLYIEQPSQPSILSYRCTSCNKQIRAGTISFAGLMSKHRHKRPSSYFFKCVKVVDG